MHSLLCWLAVVCLLHTADAAGRVVQLITENPSPFVAADPNDAQYVVTLFDEDHQPSELPQSGLLRHMVMTDAAGQRYNCSIPGTPSHFSSTLVAQQAAQQAAVSTRTPFELLDSLTGLCLYRQDGLWTYEICHKKHVRQFRQGSLPLSKDGTAVFKVTDPASLKGLMQAVEAGDTEGAMKELGQLLTGGDGTTDDAAKGKEDFSCGQYSGDEVQTEAILEDAGSSGHHMKYVSHVYSGGADCLLTGAPRTAEVRYMCARDAKENVVLSVREFPTCNYVVVVSTPFLCKHPAFVPPVQDSRLISCLPIDEQGQAVLKELQALAAAAPKAIGDGAVEADAVRTPRIAASAPAAATAAAAAADTPAAEHKASGPSGSARHAGDEQQRQQQHPSSRHGRQRREGDGGGPDRDEL